MKLLNRHFLLCIALLSTTGLVIAQGRPDHDRDKPNAGHGRNSDHGNRNSDHARQDERGMPPGQARKGERGVPPGQARKGERGLPPGQAKKYFREQDRDHFYGYYRRDADRWRGRKRPYFVPGHYIARTYVIQPVPQEYWMGAVPPPPPGYRYGYVRGYVVAYNPTTRIIADVLDLVSAASQR